MPLVLDATVGGATSNAYCSDTDGDAYFLGRNNADAWTNATTAQKQQAIVFATSLLERERWQGAKGSTPQGALTQALAWPRRWAPTLEFDAQPEYVTDVFIDLSVVYYSSLTIPTPLIRATCELALEILRAGTTDPFGRTGDPYRDKKSSQVDVIRTDYLELWYRARGLGRFPSVITLIAHLLRAGDGVQVERV